MKNILFSILFSAFFLSSFSQDIVPLSDIFMQNHKLTAVDLSKLQVYVKFVNSHIYKEPVYSPDVVTIGNIRLKNLTSGVILSSDYRPASKCKINVDFGNDAIVTFYHNAGDNEFYTLTGGICLMLFTDDIIEKPAPVRQEVVATGRKINQSDLQSIIDKAPDYSTLNIPFGSYISNQTININERNSLVILFSPGSEIFCSSMYDDVISITNSHNIKIINGQFKHIKLTQDQCSGSVFQIYYAENISLENCDINGCGIIGINASEMKNLIVKKCYIHENRYSAYSFGGKISGVKLISNKIENNPKYASWEVDAIRNLDIQDSEY